MTDPITPEDVLADGADGADMGGTYVRKGSVAAFLGNVRALEGLDPSGPEHAAIARQIRSLRPALDAVGLFDVLTVRDPAVAQILGL